MDLKTQLINEKDLRINGCLYHNTQINFAYNSNRIEGNRLTEDQTRYIFETRSIGFNSVRVYLIDTCLSAQDRYQD